METSLQLARSWLIVSARPARAGSLVFVLLAIFAVFSVPATARVGAPGQDPYIPCIPEFAEVPEPDSAPAMVAVTEATPAPNSLPAPKPATRPVFSLYFELPDETEPVPDTPSAPTRRVARPTVLASYFDLAALDEWTVMAPISAVPAFAPPAVARSTDESPMQGPPIPEPAATVAAIPSRACVAPPLVTLAANPTDCAVHVVRPGDNLIGIASGMRSACGYYSLVEALDALRTANGIDGTLLHPGQRLLLPSAPASKAPPVRNPTRDGSDLRGIYLTGPACAHASIFARVDEFVAAGGNGVVFDVKDIDGAISWRSRHPLASWGPDRSAPLISDLPELLRRLHDRDLYVVARIALFLDGELGRVRPDLALRDENGQPWRERGAFWMDPAQPEVRAYNLGLALEIARAGVDEVQLDYVRFPTNGWIGDWQGDLASTAARRQAVIGEFLAALADTLAPLGTKISADVYGIAAWQRVEDLAVTGQHVPTFAEHVDFICPMIYPSHFSPGFEGWENPAAEPEHFVAEGVRRFVALAADGAAIRPWLQAFPWRVENYDGTYVTRQIGAADAAGGAGWCLWNPAGRYAIACAGLRAGETAARDLVLIQLPESPGGGASGSGSLPGSSTGGW